MFEKSTENRQKPAKTPLSPVVFLHGKHQTRAPANQRNAHIGASSRIIAKSVAASSS